MTIKELRAYPSLAETCESEPFKTLVSFHRAKCPYLRVQMADPTSIVRNEGMIQGWMACLEALENAHRVPEKQPAPEQTRLYQDPESSRKLNPPN
jgi:hypothetical protein